MTQNLPTKIRGLDIRVAYTKAKLDFYLTNSVGAEEAKWEALFEAQQQGYSDHRDGLCDNPLMFADEPELVNAWNSGQEFAIDCMEEENCSYWHDSMGNPCPFHG